MSIEADVSFLRERIRELEKSVEELEKSPLKRSPRERIFIILNAGCLWFGVMAFFGLGTGPRSTPFYFEANHVQTQSVSFENPDNAEERWGKIDGETAKIRLEGEKGSVEIDPTGTRIEGPDGTLILKPEKK